MKPLIVMVDDMENNLIVFEAMFEDKYEVKSFQNTSDALEALKSLDPMLIIADQKGNKMTGVDFLAQARKIRPKAIRILHTGYSEEELIIEAIRKARIHDFIRKPCRDEELNERMKAAIDLYSELNGTK